MKDKTKNSRIVFSSQNVDTILHCLKNWITVDKEKFNHQTAIVIDTFNHLEQKILKQQVTYYTLNLNCKQLSYIHDIVAEDYLQIKSINKENALEICENVEHIMKKNYNLDTTDLVYPIYNWNKILKN